MPDLLQSLNNIDSGFLRIITALWEINLQGEMNQAHPEIEPAKALAEAMLQPGRLASILEALPDSARQALIELVNHQGKLEWAGFLRKFGTIREMGIGRRDREQPYLQPVSTTEVLWYRMLVGRAFMDTPSGPVEFAYIPSDLLYQLTEFQQSAALPGRPASPLETTFPILVKDHILDHACTLLAAVRLGMQPDSPEFIQARGFADTEQAITVDALKGILIAAELVNPDTGLPNPDSSRHFMELNRGKALALLARAWLHSPTFNELFLMPGLKCEGEWRNDPLSTRYALLDFLKLVPNTDWWSLDSFIQYLKQNKPDYQRPAGDYDTWYIRDISSGEYLRGFDAWDRVDGELIRFLITGPLHWLGITEIAMPAPDKPVTAFRRSPWAAALLNGAPPSGLDAEEETPQIGSDGRLRVNRLVPRLIRYQLARFSTWESVVDGIYTYQLTPSSLERARVQNLRVGHLLTLLRRSALTVPPNLVKALDRWENFGVEAQIETLLVLRVRTPDVLNALRNSRYARFLGELIGPTAVIVKPGAWLRIQSALVEMGYFSEINQVEK